MGNHFDMSRCRFRLILAVAAIAAAIVACADREPVLTTVNTPTTTFETPATPAGPKSALADQAFAILKELTGDYSPRESTTEQELEASQHLLSHFRELGYTTSIQEFSVTWYNRTRMDLSSQVSDAPESVDAFTAEWSPRGVVTGLLADVREALEMDIPDAGLSGRIALIKRGTITLDKKVKHVADAGAVGAVIFNNHRGMFYGSLYRESSIPVIMVSHEDGRMLQDLTKQGEAKATIWSGDETTRSRNVIADKLGTARRDRTVIIGAHYDTVADTQGANDNGSGIATALTIADQIAGRDYPFNIRIILFGAEEVGLYGSYHYVDNMGLRDTDNTIAMMNFDAFGSGTKLGVTGDDVLVDVAKQIGEDLDIPLFHRVRTRWAGDHAPFLRDGIPVFRVLSNDQARINSPEDEIQHINPEMLGYAAEIGIGVLDWLAENHEDW